MFCSVCLGSVEEELKMIVDTANRDFLSRKGAFMEFKRERAKSWVCLFLFIPAAEYKLVSNHTAESESLY